MRWRVCITGTTNKASGNLVFAKEETQASFAIEANPDTDGQDEWVELSFGTLREGVWPGENSRATVTLEDKGLLELTVSFAQAEYTIEEGGTALVEIRLVPAADRRVVVPLEATPRAGATSEDYRGVPESHRVRGRLQGSGDRGAGAGR